MAKCKCEWCNEEALVKEGKGAGYCGRHSQQIYLKGECYHTRFDPHYFTIEGDVAYMPLYYQDGTLKATVIIDAEDVERVGQYKWNKQNKGNHVEAYVDKKVTQLHRFIMNETDSNVLIDHINRNPLDNRKCNLRRCTKQQNCCNRKVHKQNKTGHKNISIRNGRYAVHIYKNGKQHYIGSYAELEDAIKARDEALEKLHGEFASRG